MLLFMCLLLLLLIPTLAGISILVFLMIHMIPGDPAKIMMGERGNAEDLAALRAEMGLDEPLHIQFGRYAGGLLQGDLGRSLRTREKISTELLRRFPATFELTLVSMAIAIVCGGLAGVVAAARKGRLVDYLCMVGATAGISLPVFWLALMLILLLAVQLPLLPVSGRISTHVYIPSVTHFYLVDSLLAQQYDSFVAALSRLILPGATMALFVLAPLTRMTRASMLAVLGSDLVRTGEAVGLSRQKIVVVYALRNAILPVLTTSGMVVSSMLGANILVEKVFSWPGVASYALDGLLASDYASVQGFVLLMAGLCVAINLTVDTLYGIADPRVSLD